MPKLDPLTGLLDGRNLEKRLEGLMDRADDAGRPVSVIIADLGGLKRVNAEYGWEAGDVALKAVAVLLPASMPESALCYRLGGDAFVVILPDTNAECAQTHAERLQEVMVASNIEVRPGKSITIRAFVGVADYPADARTPRALVKAADRRMQATKLAEDAG